MYYLLTLVLIVFCAEARKDGACRGKGWKHQHQYENIPSNEEQSNCSSVYCPQPESPLNGQVSFVETKIGYSATFTCDQNYTMCGTNKITCAYDGKWDTKSPVCIKSFDLDTNVTVTYGDTVYYFSNEIENFNGAQVFCENLGGNLLSIDSKAEYSFITCLSMVDNKGFNPRYIGLINNNGTWEWTNGQPVTETYWYDIVVNEDWHYCGARWHLGWTLKWKNFPKEECDETLLPFICEMNNI